MKQALRNAIHYLFKDLGFYTPFRPFFGGLGTVFMFHRLQPQSDRQRIGYNQDLEVTTEYLDRLLSYCQEEGYAILSLDEVHEALMGAKQKQPFVCFTFDDGYEDNYSLALPVFEKHQKPFAIYITTAFPNHEARLWWYLLEEEVFDNQSVVLEGGATQLTLTTTNFQERETAFHTFRRMILDAPPDISQSYVENLARRAGIDHKSYAKKHCLSWEQVKELAHHPLCTIGSHTSNHKALAQLDKETLRREIKEANDLIESRVGKKIVHFAYPFGGPFECGPREFSLCRELGFKTATTTRVGNIFPGHSQHLTALPRVTVEGSTPIPAMKWFVNGANQAIDYRFRRRLIHS